MPGQQGLGTSRPILRGPGVHDSHQLLGALLVRVAFLEEEAWKETGGVWQKGMGAPGAQLPLHDLFLSFCLAAKAGLPSEWPREGPITWQPR